MSPTVDSSRKLFLVRADWDPEAEVWVATSEDVPGLVTEADTMEALQEKLRVLVPELLEANGVFVDPDVADVPLTVVAHRDERIRLRP